MEFVFKGERDAFRRGLAEGKEIEKRRAEKQRERAEKEAQFQKIQSAKDLLATGLFSVKQITSILKLSEEEVMAINRRKK